MAIPVLLAAVGGVLITASRSMAIQVLIALGISVATYQGIDASISWLKSQALGSINGLPADLLSLVSFMGVGNAINIIFSAMVMRMTLTAIAGVHKRWIKT